jgi:hypothetical protein
VCRIPFRAKAVGNAGLTVEKIRFGAREGKGITPEVITDNRLTVVSEEKNPILLFIVSAFLITAAGFGLFFRKCCNTK